MVDGRRCLMLSLYKPKNHRSMKKIIELNFDELIPRINADYRYSLLQNSSEAKYVLCIVLNNVITVF